LAIFFLFPSKEFLPISFKILEDACLDLIVRKHVYNCSCIFTGQLITYYIVHVGVRTCTLYRIYIYGREYRMRRNRNGRNVQLGPGKQTAKTGVWFGEIERKLAKLLKTTFTYRSSSKLFYG
jgi:hypothetical protein